MVYDSHLPVRFAEHHWLLRKPIHSNFAEFGALLWIPKGCRWVAPMVATFQLSTGKVSFGLNIQTASSFSLHRGDHFSETVRLHHLAFKWCSRPAFSSPPVRRQCEDFRSFRSKKLAGAFYQHARSLAEVWLKFGTSGPNFGHSAKRNNVN